MADKKPIFKYQEMFELAKSKTEYRNLTKDGVKVVKVGGREILEVEPEALVKLAREAIRDVSFLLRPAHQKQVAEIFSDPEASENDKFIAYCMLENAANSAQCVLPFCQDTGAATVVAKKGEQVWTRCERNSSPKQKPTLRKPPLLPGRSLDGTRKGIGKQFASADITPKGMTTTFFRHQGRRFGQQDHALPGNQGHAHAGKAETFSH